jgi:hypothetical protein
VRDRRAPRVRRQKALQLGFGVLQQCVVIAATAIVVPLPAIRGIRSERPRRAILAPAPSEQAT